MLSRPDAINVAEVVRRTKVEGPGCRYAVWVQGCAMRCPGCCNPELLPFVERDWRSVEALAAEILGTGGINGVSLLGGEPFAQAEALATLAAELRRAGLSVITFSGYTLAQLRRLEWPGVARLLALSDVLIDGPFVSAQASLRRRYVGSDNQQIHFLSKDRFGELQGPSGWPRGDGAAELRFHNGCFSVNGHPRANLEEFLAPLRFTGHGRR